MTFDKPFTRQAQLPLDALHAAQRVLSSADLHRYQAADRGLGEVAALEQDYAAWQGAQFCLAVTSCGQAMQLALRAVGVCPGDQVLTNGFTLAPVPGAICAVGAQPLLVDITDDLVIDLVDLHAKARQSRARVLLLSHMRGHLVDMDKVCAIARDLKLTVIEDCAHTMGATWRGTKSGNFGRIGCFSTQSYKHLNSGEGGLLTTDDPDVMARAIIMSGSYMNYANHGAAPDERYFDNPKYDCPNMSARMDMLRAAILRPQLAKLDHAVDRWNTLCAVVAKGLEPLSAIKVPKHANSARLVGSSIQFRVPDFTAKDCQSFVLRSQERGVVVKWFGDTAPVGYTSNYTQWRYVSSQSLPQTDAALSTLFDMRIPLTFDIADCEVIAKILCEVAQETLSEVHN